MVASSAGGNDPRFESIASNYVFNEARRLRSGSRALQPQGEAENDELTKLSYLARVATDGFAGAVLLHLRCAGVVGRDIDILFIGYGALL